MPVRIVALLYLSLLAAASAHADFVVNTIADEDASNAACSLREAIKAVNTHANYNGCTSVSPDVDEFISFALPSETITLGSALPPITTQVFIDGTTQAATVCAPVPTVHVKIAGTSGSGLEFDAGSDGSAVRGVGISGFTDGILIYSSGVSVACSVIQNNTNGVHVRGSSATIGVGDATHGSPNLISGNSFANVWLPVAGADNAVISGNYIGVDATGLTALDSGYGIYVGSGISGVRIGLHVNDGSAARQRNVIGVHASSGVVADIFLAGASNTVIAGNYIGVGADGHTALAIGAGSGINISGDMNLVGCDGSGSWDDCRNVIATPVTGIGLLTSAVRVNSGSTNTGIINNFLGTAADGATTLGGNNYTAGVELYGGGAMVARNVIDVGSQGYGIVLEGFPDVPVFLNISNGGLIDSRDNCIHGNGYGIELSNTPTTPNVFTNNWWGSADGPNDPSYTPPIFGSGDYINSGSVTVVPFLTTPSIYCGFDRIFANGFE